MGFEESNPEHSGLTFFGQVSASISHEIKNALAIINENAGLLEDLVLLSKKGLSPDIERLSRLAETVQRQVRRADDLVKKMNRFAHSADHKVEKVDLYAAAGFVKDLCGRMISMGRVAVTIMPPAESVEICTHRYYVQNMLWVCIESIMKSSRPDAEIKIHFEKTSAGVIVMFRVDPAPAGDFWQDLFSGDVSALRGNLQLEPITGPAPGEMAIRMPANVQP